MENKRENQERVPFTLSPAGKDYLWGGTRLKDDFSKELKLDPLAETWECSTHPDGPSMVKNGPMAGQTLTEVLQTHPDYLGTHQTGNTELPILIKFIDAKQNLSVQVHPDDAYAAAKEHGSRGKSEMWYVLDAAKDAHLVYGFLHDMTPEKVRRQIASGRFEQSLQKVKIETGDMFYIEAGTVHAIGAGALVAEIQESSNLTYRLYDYHRVDKEGKQRELHIDKALEVANLKSSTKPRQHIRQMRYRPGCEEELICRCPYFRVSRWMINTERHHEMVSLQTGEESFAALLCVEGCGILLYEGGEIPFFKGDCLFVPALSVPMKLHGKAKLLYVDC